MKNYYARKREAERADADRKEQANMRSPKLNNRSKKLVQRKIDGKPQQKVEDRLLNKGASLKNNRALAEQQQEYEAKLNAYPLITPQAARLQNSGDVADRLLGY